MCLQLCHLQEGRAKDVMIQETDSPRGSTVAKQHGKRTVSVMR